MPQIIEYIDKIARDKGRGVLYVAFDGEKFPSFEYESWEVRKNLLKWFEANNIAVFPCGDIANETEMIAYRGQLYIDVPFDESNSDYMKVWEHLENSDDSTRIPGVTFIYLALELAMKNKHHDEPGFWENWADNF